MKAFVKISFALLVIATMVPISEASAGRRHRRGGCGHHGGGCYGGGCQVNYGGYADAKYTSAPAETSPSDHVQAPGKWAQPTQAPTQAPMQAPVQAPAKWQPTQAPTQAPVQAPGKWEQPTQAPAGKGPMARANYGIYRS